MKHPLHEKIGSLIDTILQGHPDIKIVKDPACCPGEETDLQQIPLFRTKQKSLYTRYCCVDMLILKREKIRGIVEIEEANIKPTQICGKFLTSALSNFYIHEKDGGIVEMADSVFFLQVLDSKKLKEGSVKRRQFESLEEAIRKILPLKDSRVNEYRIFVGNQDDSFNNMIYFLKKEVAL
jgi:hypothetical protein